MKGELVELLQNLWESVEVVYQAVNNLLLQNGSGALQRSTGRNSRVSEILAGDPLWIYDRGLINLWASLAIHGKYLFFTNAYSMCYLSQQLSSEE